MRLTVPWPDTLVGRTVAVVLAGLVITNLVGLAFYVGDRSDLLMSNRGRIVAEAIARSAERLEDALPQDRERLTRELRRPRMRLAWTTQPWVEAADPEWRTRLIRSAFQDAMHLEDDSRLRLVIRRLGDIDQEALRAPPFRSLGPRHHESEDRPRSTRDGPPPPDLDILLGSLALSDGTWLNFGVPLKAVRSIWAPRLFFGVGVVTVIVLVVSVWAVRRAARPLTTLAHAADRLGRDVDAPALAEEGPREVRTASRAFNTMQQRLQRFVRDRTQMLAAISHDLRTPITRMRLRAEFVEDPEQRDRMLADLAEMETMIAATLAFARDDPALERPQPFDLGALLGAVCADAADAGADATYDGPTHAQFVGRLSALRRAFNNLVDNAVAYGKRARVSAQVASGSVVVTVDDDGPGLKEVELERVFDPFVRGESSRSRETGGTGLGLAVVRAAVRAHGGDVTLANRPGGGLRATVVLPLAPLS